MAFILGATAFTRYYSGDSTVIDLNCDGTEEKIFDCSYNSIERSCNYVAAHVRCQGMYYVKIG